MLKTSQDIGQLIKETRQSQGLTQEQLAGLAGTGRRFIIDLEAGKETCHLGKTLKILAMLGLELTIGKNEG